ncbi:response regulator [Blastochloris sulfoviridis]|uniref:Response regulator n=1 Tax=Blastochloris sulfoviridis TaxID=50712 RepID=A0A5M6HN64_9HYPH|nr:response regulator [Blastochloris sulfoviridis]KAA5597293.1 response regulator [Blastochloris sulfoviridis]
MTNLLGRPLRILVAEDDALIAFDLVDALEMFGCVAAGPVATVKAALEHADDPANAIDGALLDLDLRGQRSYPVAAALMRRNIPFAFTSGYGIEAIEADFRACPCLLKPTNRSDLLAVLRGFLTATADAPQNLAGPDAQSA